MIARTFALAAILIFTLLANASAERRLLVFASASMKEALDAIAVDFESRCECQIVISYAGSGTLARQIEAGAPAGIFISADQLWMDWLQDKNAFVQNSRRIIAQNRLVVALSNQTKSPQNTDLDGIETIENSADRLAKMLQSGRIAMGDPDFVPAGRYAKQALEKLGLWQQLSGRLVFGENVRVPLSLVARGDVNAAIIYRSDVKVDPRVRAAYTFAVDSHIPIFYPAALVKNSVVGEQFLEFLASGNARQIFLKFGFTIDSNDG